MTGGMVEAKRSRWQVVIHRQPDIAGSRIRTERYSPWGGLVGPIEIARALFGQKDVIVSM